MKSYLTIFCSVFVISFLTACSAVGTVFEVGKWYGILLTVIIIGIVFFLFGRTKK